MEFFSGTICFLKSRNEREIESFFVNLANDIRSLPETWDIEFKLERAPYGASLGSWAGIVITVVLGLPPCVRATLELWERISKKLDQFRKEGEHPRLIGTHIFENIARCELYRRGIDDFELRKQEAIGLFPDLTDYADSIDANLDPEPRARYVFLWNRKTIVIEISNQGEILLFRTEDS